MNDSVRICKENIDTLVEVFELTNVLAQVIKTRMFTLILKFNYCLLAYRVYRERDLNFRYANCDWPLRSAALANYTFNKIISRIKSTIPHFIYGDSKQSDKELEFIFMKEWSTRRSLVMASGQAPLVNVGECSLIDIIKGIRQTRTILSK